MESDRKARVQQLADLLLACLSPREIRLWVKKQGWELSEDEQSRLLLEASQELNNIPPADLLQHVRLSRRRLDTLYARSLQITDFKACLAIEKARIQLLEVEASLAGERHDASDAMTRAHLLPLGLAPEHAPTEEHARLAADEIRRFRRGE